MATNIAIVAAGEMGAAVAAKLVKSGCAVFTNLDGRSTATRTRAAKAGMTDVPFSELSRRAEWVLSILPPSESFNFAQSFLNTVLPDTTAIRKDKLIFVDCNAVSPQTVKKIASLFEGTSITFIDAGIIGGPPTDTYNPTIYASAEAKDEKVLDEFSAFSRFGLNISPLKGEGVSGIGDASALKMSYAGITKGITGIFSTMILAAHASSPATSRALLAELHDSQPQLLQRITKSVPGMVPKAYRWVGEMEEIADFVGEGEGNVYKGLAQLYERVEGSLKRDGRSSGDVGMLLKFAEEAKRVIEVKKVE
ncbi:6-phosphogluconate dehydrogenase C-terminal domain-like protein [Phellopilus nigrolimitatus]|nr:6-phosphogluconate dehydrogenase C-terminal domain-like protein [Phellopilus nigrolimitatus]